MKQNAATMLEAMRIVNEPGMGWKTRQALLRHLGLSDEEVVALVPPPPEGKDFHPGDY